MAGKQKRLAAKAFTTLTSALILVGSLPSQAQEFIQPIEIAESLSQRECERSVLELAPAAGLEAYATEMFGASGPEARLLGQNWRSYTRSEPKLKTGSVETSNNTCKGQVLLNLDREKIEANLSRSYVCDRPIAVLSRIRAPSEGNLKPRLDPDRLQANLVRELADHDIAVVDVSELLPSIRSGLSTDNCGGYTGQAAGTCQDHVDFSEALLSAIRQIDLGIMYAMDDNFRSSKLQPLAEGGLLLTVTFDAEVVRRDVRALATVLIHQISDSDIAWSTKPTDKPGRVRQESDVELANVLLENLSESIAENVAQDCAGYSRNASTTSNAVMGGGLQ